MTKKDTHDNRVYELGEANDYCTKEKLEEFPNYWDVPFNQPNRELAEKMTSTLLSASQRS
jgi:hypothetical protein